MQFITSLYTENLNKIIRTIFIIFISSFYFLPLKAGNNYESEIFILPNEKWWGGVVALGSDMPFYNQPRLFDLSKENMNNQNVPLLLSSAGRYIWPDQPFAFQIEEEKILLYSETEELKVVEAGKTLREAFLYAASLHFPPTGKLPDKLFFSMPQYNTWIELMYNQNQKDILNYADNILEHNFPIGVFMVDDNWQKYYGNFEFKAERFPDPKTMITDLHDKGFRIMLWICPFVSADSPEFRELNSKGYLIKNKHTNSPAIMQWWNGYSAAYDLSNPEAATHFKNQLHNMQKEYGIDGFKFDAGDIAHYTDSNLLFHDTTATSADMCRYWTEIGLDFSFNEFRACWKMGNQPLVQRLGDKDYSWEALRVLIPEMLAAGLMGYSYTCPDMIGGGQFASFLNIDQSKLDQSLIVRSCQVHAMMPMMQFSVAPWRVLNEENLAICRKYCELHTYMAPYILELAQNAAETGEPIIRHMEYSFPHQGFSNCQDQFMLGDKFLIAPILTPENKRTVFLPKGRWKDDEGNIIKGPKIIQVNAPLERLPYYELIHK